jgi:ribonuclease HII
VLATFGVADSKPLSPKTHPLMACITCQKEMQLAFYIISESMIALKWNRTEYDSPPPVTLYSLFEAYRS